MFLKGIKIINILIICAFVCVACRPAAAQKTTRKNDAGSAETLIAQAAEAFSNDDLTVAKQILQKVLTLAPQNAMAHTLIGIIAERENDFPKAEKHLATAARLQPKSAEARNNYGAILLRLKKFKEAAREFTASLALNPSQRSALINLAQIQFEENNLAKAQTLFEKAKAIQSDPEISRALLVISLRLNETEKAKTNFQDYFLQFKNSPNIKQKAEIAALLLENGLAQEAVRELESALLIEEQNVDLLVQLARAYLSLKDVKAAGRLLESAVARGIDEAQIYAVLAEVYETGGFYENAIPAMRRAIERDPQNEFFRARYGLLLVDAKAPAAALIRLREALAEFPNSARLWLATGIAQLNDNKTGEARIAFQKALNIEAKLIPAMAYLAVTFADEARYDEAIKLYENALALDSKNALLHYLLADALLKLDSPDFTRVENRLKEAIALDPNLVQAHTALGRLYVRQGRASEAALAFEKSIRLQPNQAETLYQLSRVYAKLKRMNESNSVLAKFKQLNDSQKDQRVAERTELVRRLANVRF